MARPKNKIPSYLPHPSSGQARVRISGHDVYLGPYGSAESKQAYARLIAENFANGEVPTITVLEGERLTIAALVVKYDDFARSYYVKNGVPTDERYAIKAAIAPLVNLYGDTFADDFGPKRLKAVREEIIAKGRMPRAKKRLADRRAEPDASTPADRPPTAGKPLTRKYVNYRIACLVRMFKWAVEEELVPVTVYQSLKAVAALRRGRTVGVRESQAVKPVPEEHIPPVLAVVPGQIAAMIRLQLLTGMRPDEVTIMRPCDVDRQGDVWAYTPYTHKTEHRGIEKTVLLGPKSQAVLLPWLDREPAQYLFSPKEAREASLVARRKEENGTRRKKKPPKRQRPLRPARDHYDDESYCQAVERACKRAKVARWTPGRLRHNAGTEVRSKFGAEAAQLVLGHQNLSTTEIYAEKDRKQYAAIMKEIG
jgi:integrase